MIELGVDHIGSVILSGDHCRNPEIRDIVKLVGTTGRKSSIIPLFTDESLIAECLEYVQPQIVHFCESLACQGETAEDLPRIIERQQKIRERFPQIEVMRSIPVPDRTNHSKTDAVDLARRFESCSDWLLIDTYLVSDQAAQPVDGYVGITGKTCDWSIARRLVDAVKIPVILAGGIGPGNAYDAVTAVRPAGIDSCTNTNAVDAQGHPIRFQKDGNKVKTMIQAARRAARMSN
jgi:phosphoribosylanthranilate isomerase